MRLLFAYLFERHPFSGLQIIHLLSHSAGMIAAAFQISVHQMAGTPKGNRYFAVFHRRNDLLIERGIQMIDLLLDLCTAVQPGDIPRLECSIHFIEDGDCCLAFSVKTRRNLGRDACSD